MDIESTDNWSKKEVIECWHGLQKGILLTQKDLHNESFSSPTLERLGINSDQWLTLTTEFEQHFSTALGSEHML